MARKSLLFLILTTILTSGLAIAPQTMAADASASISECVSSGVTSALTSIFGKSIGGFLSKTVPTSDDKAHALSTKIDVDQCVRAALEQLKEIALSTLKRRVLNVMVDQTINWVNGGGSPQFVTNPQDFIYQAGQAAAGDVVQQIGLGQLCTGIQMPVLQFLTGGAAAGSPPFSQQITCTLNQVVGNINNFYNDFRSGGWVAFNTAWEPQNNYYGAILLGGDEIISKSIESQQAAQASMIANQGYKSTTACQEWVLRATKKDGNLAEVAYLDGSNYPDPKNPPPLDAYRSEIANNGYYNPYWYCDRLTETTPGSTIAGITNRALGAQFNSVINAQTFTDYAQALVGAAINRIIKVGVSGLLGVATPNAPAGGYVQISQSGEPVDAQNNNLVGNTGANYNGSVSSTLNYTNQTDLMTQLSLATTTLAQAVQNLSSASTTNNSVINTLKTFISWCNLNGGVFYHPNNCANLTGQLASSTDLQLTLTQMFAKTDPLQTQLTDLTAKVNNAAASALNDLVAPVNDLASSINDLASFALDANNNLDSFQTTLQASYNNCVVQNNVACN